MTPIQKTTISCLAELAKVTTEIGKLQISIANLLAQHLPDLNSEEKANLLSIADASWLQVQSLQDQAKKIQEIL